MTSNMEPISPKQAARTAELARREAARKEFCDRVYPPGRLVTDETPAERMEAERLGLKSAALRVHPFDDAPFGKERGAVNPVRQTEYACRECGCTMLAKWQEPFKRGGEGYMLITCKQQDCRMFEHTATSKSYATMDLTPYLGVKA